MRQLARILSVLFIVVVCLLVWLALPDNIRTVITNPLVLFFAAVFSIIPLIWLVENWRKVINPIVQTVYDLLTYQHRRKYFPPQILIEGYGVKRGLTVVEAAVVMQRPFDQVLALILVSCLEKEAFHFTQSGIILFEIPRLLPEDMTVYERNFSRACREATQEKRLKKLVNCLADLVKSVKLKMRGFDFTETGRFYALDVDAQLAGIKDWRVLPVVTEIVGNLEQFTLLVTAKTNPVSDAPIFKEIPEYMKIKQNGGYSGGRGSYLGGRGGGGGCACACAGCACAGCACACAGGGR
jgi:hypothetical protein